MDEALQKLIEALPERPPRSKLEPHAEVIRELRKRRRTYQEIAAFFRQHLQLSVAPSTIHEFVKTRARRASRRETSPIALPEPAAVTATAQPVSAPAAADDGTRERIRSLRRQPSAKPATDTPRFAFDPQEPLVLDPKPKEK